MKKAKFAEARVGLLAIRSIGEDHNLGNWWRMRAWLNKQGIFNDDLDGKRLVYRAVNRILILLRREIGPRRTRKKGR